MNRSDLFFDDDDYDDFYYDYDDFDDDDFDDDDEDENLGENQTLNISCSACS